jgi:hypothetical protein
MGKTFYAVQQVINGRSGCLPTKLENLDDVREFIDMCERHNTSLDPSRIKIEYRIFEVKEISL